jgi:hypothetical protein
MSVAENFGPGAWTHKGTRPSSRPAICNFQWQISPAKSYPVVTNPPYRIATKFIRRALSAVEALLLKADFLNAQERHELIRGIG